MPKLMFVIAVLLLFGCGRGGTNNGPLGASTGDGDWFCERAVDPTEWDCVQDAGLARYPKPRQPSTEMPGLATSDTGDSTATPGSPIAPPATIDDITAVHPTTNDLAQPMEPVPAETDPMTLAPKDKDDPTRTNGISDYAGISVMELPTDHFAVQLIGMSSEASLEAFAKKNQLDGSFTARVERNGELYYVFLLGLYDTRETAEQASHDLPVQLGADQPWIRSVKSIQNAVVRGNALALGDG